MIALDHVIYITTDKGPFPMYHVTHQACHVPVPTAH